MPSLPNRLEAIEAYLLEQQAAITAERPGYGGKQWLAPKDEESSERQPARQLDRVRPRLPSLAAAAAMPRCMSAARLA